MRTDTPQAINLKDYKPIPYSIDKVELDFSLEPEATRVTARIALRPNTASAEKSAPLVFDGEKIKLISVSIDGAVLGDDRYALSESKLIIASVPQKSFTLVIVTECNPTQNTELSGLYMSNGMYCTQCEAQGFRRITYFYDRPDVMAIFKVRMDAPKSMPVLLSNGNAGETGAFGADRHFAVWDDPHPKPTYLFALVAGDLAGVHDHFTTMNGRKVQLGIYVEKGKEDRCAWAMEALKASMRWDETAFGREYDLDVFNIVAVSDFNMGAMENKGLNIFNDKYILALPETATDTDYVLIEAIIAHEYFHNWTGNRITCRDWFQLCLKEGLTVFRDQEFTSDLRSRAVKRIQDVKTLRSKQFPEDQGPLSHPVRPESYIEINNFYTPTVYEKGAELCRMMKTLIGDVVFRKAMDLYFMRHDGEAATVEDFVICMADASGRDMKQFFRWYEQAGTPKLSVRGTYNAAAKTFEVAVVQSTPRQKGQKKKLPLHLPLALGLVGPDGHDMPLQLEGQGRLNAPLIEVTQGKQVFRFTGVSQKPVLSINRGFTAPVVMKTNHTAAKLLFLMGHDTDSFNRWEAAQTLAKALIVKTVAALSANKKVPSTSGFAKALELILADAKLDDAFKALLLVLPTEAEVAAFIGKDVDSDIVFTAREMVRTQLAKKLMKPLLAAYARTGVVEAYKPDPLGTAQRSLRYTALGAIAAANAELAIAYVRDELKNVSNMTAETGALSSLLWCARAEREALLNEFYTRHKSDPLIIDKWFGMNASIPGADASQRIERLLKHPDFKLSTPNRVYALIGGFSGGNPSGFNAADGSGYRVVADVIIALNAINPQVASRMATGFRSWRLYESKRRAHAQAEMQRILATTNLSRDVFEIISRTLQA
jgi:aminopeptidase N